MSTVITVDGDMLDALVHRHYGDLNRLPAVLEANRHLEAYGPVLPAGVAVQMPPVPAAPSRPTVRLWGDG